MNNYTMDCYETKREILNFSKKMTIGLNKTITKFVIDMQRKKLFNIRDSKIVGRTNPIEKYNRKIVR